MDQKEKFINELNTKLNSKLDQQSLMIVNGALITALEHYDITLREEAIATIDDVNFNIIKQYTACLNVDGKSKRTIKCYYMILVNFSNYLNNKRFTDVTTYDVRLFLGKMVERNLSKQTIENNRCTLSAFYKWMQSEEMINKNPMQTIKPIKLDEVERKPFSNIELEAIRCACRNIKERAIIEFFIASGVRVSELCHMKISDVDLNSKTAVVRCGKGAKDRNVYITDVSALYIKKYLDTRTDNDDILFRNGRSGCYTPSGIEKMVKVIGKKANVTDVHPHRFRRTCATKLASQIGIETVSKILGHSELNTTMRYVYLNDTKIKNEYQRATI